ncbi:hypothetical protein QYF61_019845 [Mycteria americana]|uniref:Uncharacterized protein n=1 Tax=Mycteria americana TaxID=33587 RepID=A0AAN7P8P9_MYCAM|nr:hypothetical protein QYF61_019845 [Mycteria americana]
MPGGTPALNQPILIPFNMAGQLGGQQGLVLTLPTANLTNIQGLVAAAAAGGIMTLPLQNLQVSFYTSSSQTTPARLLLIWHLTSSLEARSTEKDKGTPELKMEVQEKLGGDTARTADPNWPKGYSIPYGVMLSIETGGVGQGAAIAARGWAGHQLAGGKLCFASWKHSIQLRCFSLDTLHHLNVCLVVRAPKLNTVFEVRPHQCRVQGHDHFPSPSGHTISDTSQDALGLLGHLGTLLAHIQPAINQHPRVLFCLAAFQPLFPKPVALHGVVVTQVQDLALSLVEPHTVGPGPSIQPVQVPLQSLPTLQQINAPAQLGVICKLTEGALDPFIQIIDKDIKQNWPQY